MLSVLLLSGCTQTVAQDPGGTKVSASPLPQPQIEENRPSPRATETPPRPVDGGARPGATGEARTTDDGTVDSYLIADGDFALSIADRFGVQLDQLANAQGRRLTRLTTLHAGDQIRFIAPLSGDPARCFYDASACGPR